MRESLQIANLIVSGVSLTLVAAIAYRAGNLITTVDNLEKWVTRIDARCDTRHPVNHAEDK